MTTSQAHTGKKYWKAQNSNEEKKFKDHFSWFQKSLKSAGNSRMRHWPEPAESSVIATRKNSRIEVIVFKSLFFDAFGKVAVSNAEVSNTAILKRDYWENHQWWFEQKKPIHLTDDPLRQGSQMLGESVSYASRSAAKTLHQALL